MIVRPGEAARIGKELLGILNPLPPYQFLPLAVEVRVAYDPEFCVMTWAISIIGISCDCRRAISSLRIPVGISLLGTKPWTASDIALICQFSTCV